MKSCIWNYYQGEALKGLVEYFTGIIDEHDEWEEEAHDLLHRVQDIS